MKSVRLLAALMLGAIGLVGCGDGSVKSPTFTAILLALSIDNPANSQVAAGRRLQLTTTGEFSTPPRTPDDIADLRAVTPSYTVSNSTIARIEGSELVGLEVGLVMVTASQDGVSSPSVQFSVTPAVLEQIVVTPVNPDPVASGLSQDFVAMGIYSDDPDPRTIDETVTWESSAVGVAQVSPTSGETTTAQTAQNLNTGLAPNPNTTTITASATNSEDDEIEGSSVLTVGAPVFVTLNTVIAPGNDTPAAPNVALGRTEQFTAQGVRTDGSGGNIPNGELMWNSSATAIATISNTGLATTVAEGTTTIMAALVRDSGESAMVTLTVTPPVLEELSIVRSDAAPIPDSGIACAAPLEAVGLTALGRYSNGAGQFEPIRNDAVTPINWADDGLLPLTVLVTPTSGPTTSVTCSLPGQESVTTSTVSEEGVPLSDVVLFDVGLLAAPTAAMTAIEPASSTVDGKSSTPGPQSLGSGQSGEFWARIVLEDGSEFVVSNQSLDWSSDQPGVATVDANGIVTAVGAGTATIRATLKDGEADDISDPAKRTTAIPVQVAP